MPRKTITEQTMRRRGRISVAFAGGFLLLIAAAAFSDELPVAVFVGYLATSVLTFTAYAIDKSAAVRQRRRTPESTLHMLALFGGWPGAVLAQQLLRHKSSKKTFQVAFWVMVILNCAVVGWLMLPPGVALLQATLRAFR